MQWISNKHQDALRAAELVSISLDEAHRKINALIAELETNLMFVKNITNSIVTNGIIADLISEIERKDAVLDVLRKATDAEYDLETGEGVAEMGELWEVVLLKLDELDGTERLERFNDCATIDVDGGST